MSAVTRTDNDREPRSRISLGGESDKCADSDGEWEDCFFHGNRGIRFFRQRDASGMVSRRVKNAAYSLFPLPVDCLELLLPQPEKQVRDFSIRHLEK